jgi:hypothetical protein
MWTLVVSATGDEFALPLLFSVAAEGNLITAPVSRCNSRTLAPPLPIIRPT